MKKSLIVLAFLSAVLLSGCGKEKGGMACDWVEIGGVMKEICVYDENKKN
jgi:major membrane immunogen (membrane-anchored lipoprotein)